MGVEGVDATEVAVLGSLLEADNIPDENQSLNCMSCGEAMKGLYCHACGQKNDNYRRSIFALIGDLVGSIFSVESRIWRSWFALLFKPGKVAREYADGRRSHWSSPVRVYLAISIILFAFMSVTNTHLMSLDVEASIKDGVDKPRAELVSSDINLRVKPPLFFETQAKIDARNASRDMDLIAIAFTDRVKTAEEIAEEQEALKVAQDSVPIDLPEAGIKVEKSEDGSSDTIVFFGDRKISGQQSRDFMLSFIKNPQILTRSFNTWLPRLMFIMMPFTMLFGAIFIRDKKKGLLFDHLVHAAYIHAVAFFLMLVGILVSKVLDPSLVILCIGIILFVYLPISLKRMFGRGWFKTILTTYTVGFMYVVILFFLLTVTIAVDMGGQLAA